MTTLVIDTSLGACQVGLVDGARVIAGASEAMERGHQERLAPMAAEVMAGAGLAFTDVTKIVVTLGPGSFTGLRVGLAFAKGLRLATDAPLAGVGTLAALAASAAADGLVAGVIDARRGQVYWQAFDEGRARGEPEASPIEDAAARLHGRVTLAGPGAALLGAEMDKAEIAPMAAPDLAALGRLAEGAAPVADLRPIYLRAAVAQGA